MTIPKVSVPEVAPGQDAALYLNSLTDQSAVGAYMDFYVAGLGLPPADPELVELVRLRNGVAQSCQYCLSVRLEGGDELGDDIAETVVRFEHSELPDRHKAALRLAAAFLSSPSALTRDARNEALEHFSPRGDRRPHAQAHVVSGQQAARRTRD